MAALTQGIRLRPDYNEPYLARLLARLDAEDERVVHRLVRERAAGGLVRVQVRPGDERGAARLGPGP
jgi:hypothetical protein